MIGSLSARRVAMVLLVLVGTAAASAAQTPRLEAERDPQPARATLAIVGGMLIDGHDGPPLHHSIILVDGNRIVAVGTRDTLHVPAGAKVIEAGGMTVMPGLIDAHVHMDLIGHSDYSYWHKTYFSRYQEIMAISARQLLLNGVTTAVDLSGQPEALIATRTKIDKGEIVGPRMKASMGWIANWPDDRWERHHRKTFTWNVHTVDEARAAALKVISYGADIVKLYDGLSEEQVKVIAEEAHKKGLRVTGHVGDRRDLLMRINAGQDAIEHLDLGSRSEPTIHPDVLRGLLDRQTYVTPAMIVRMVLPKTLEWPGWADNQRARSTTPPAIWADIYRSLANPHRLSYFGSGVSGKGQKTLQTKFRQLSDAGVRVLVGTDGGTPLNFQTDATWQEMELMEQFGVPPLEVIGLATRRNAEYIRMADQLGTIKPGKLADIIVVDGNPLLSMRDLRNVVVVVKDGKVYKGSVADAAPSVSEPAGRGHQ